LPNLDSGLSCDVAYQAHAPNHGNPVRAIYALDKIPPSVINLLTGIAVLLISGSIFATPIRQHGSLLPYAQDDLYYYLVASRHIVHGFGSTFDGITPTNGYHPLYMLFAIVVTRINDSLRGVYEALWLLDMLSVLISFYAMRALISQHTDNPWLSNGLAVAFLCLFYHLLFMQMEVTLTVPMALLVLFRLDREPQSITVREWMKVGFLSSLLVLSRLDSIILVALCGLSSMLVSQWRIQLSIRKASAFLGTFLPLLLIYFAINYHLFHRFMPISGSAKQLRRVHGIFMPAVYRSLTAGTIIMFVLAIITLACLPILWRKLTPSLRVLSIPLLLFPFVHWGFTFYLSNWMLWSWYKYSVILAMVVTLLFTAISLELWAPVLLFSPAILLLALFALASARYTPASEMQDISAAALFIRTFAATHPGRYAMGDRAGMAAYSTDQPMIQTEGLMMDEAFLQRIRRSEPLLQVLNDYHADYYVSFDRRKPGPWPTGRCFQAREPNQAGPDSPTLNALFCKPPVAQMMAPSGRTIIFDLHDQHP
jgi:hypothetical protein